MNKKIKLSGIFFGWWMVIATGVICFLGVGFAAYGFSVLFKSLSGELGLSRAATSMASSVQALGYGIIGPAGGWASDKYGPRWVILAGILIMVTGCVLMFFVNSLWSLLVAWGILIGIGYSMGFTVITDKAIVNWFVKKSGVALNVKFAMQSISGMVLLPVIAWLINHYGWRWTCLIAGITISVVCLPLVWIFIKPKRPEYYGLLPDGETGTGLTRSEPADENIALSTWEARPQFTLKQSLKSRTFWMMILLFTFSGLASPIMTVHCVPFLTDMGISSVQAASMMSIWLTCSIPVRIITGFVVDRLKTRDLHFLLVAGYLIQALGVGLYLLTRNSAMIYVWFILYGIGSGLSSAPFLTMLADYFGRRSFGIIIGVIMLLNLPVNLAAPVYVGWVYDSTLSYTNVFTLFGILLVCSAAVSGFITQPKLRKAT